MDGIMNNTEDENHGKFLIKLRKTPFLNLKHGEKYKFKVRVFKVTQEYECDIEAADFESAHEKAHNMAAEGQLKKINKHSFYNSKIIEENCPRHPFFQIPKLCGYTPKE